MDDIDLMLTLQPHGWSTCCFFIRDEKYELIISHVFSDPYVDIMDALTKLIKGNNNENFFWFGEPGGAKIEIKRLFARQDVVCVTITEFSESYGEKITDSEKLVEFEIKLNHLIMIVYFQLKKTYSLLKEKSYAQNRQNDFPFDTFILFEQIVKTFLAKYVL